ncbi:MAG TPA: regulatory iron-sulfur-containing complex subunit RicT [Gemmatimonadaceae bacterium]|nr:regulatory iron-sulfur-containing complex subunit RicT [Gemmatimonadaceae bacterium]
MTVAPHLVEVAFKGKRKEFFLWDGEDPPRVESPVIVEVDRGEDFGRVHAIGERAATRCGGCAHGCGTAAPERKVLRAATPEDERRANELPDEDESARRKASERVKAHALVMKVSDAEWQWDRKKLTLYFTAEKRVDFRALVRDLAAAFRTRIELKQIGVRDEAKRLGGIGRCGREYCSASWLPELRPVNLQVAKDQHLSLNPSQISGACGRLMCCLRYEHDYYVQSRKRFPKEGRILVTSLGEEKVLANDIFGDRVTLRGPEGDTRVVPLAELKQELEQRATIVEEHEDDAPVLESATDAMLEEEVQSPSAARATATSRPSAPSAANTVAPQTVTPLPGETPAADANDRRPHRRRGRRGGRRGRPGGESSGGETPPSAPDGE